MTPSAANGSGLAGIRASWTPFMPVFTRCERAIALSGQRCPDVGLWDAVKRDNLIVAVDRIHNFETG